MNSLIVPLLVLTIVLAISLMVVAVKIFLMLKEQANSQAKLGYIVREDAKQYFEEAAAKIIDTNLLFRESYVEIVEEGTASAMSQTASSIEGSIVSAQQEANQIILRARDDARRINVEARKMAVEEMSRSLENAADTLSWVMERYVHETFDVDQHKYLIDRLVDEYINEYRT